MLLTSGRDEAPPDRGPTTRVITPHPEAPERAIPAKNAGAKHKFARTMLGIAPLPPAPGPTATSEPSKEAEPTEAASNVPTSPVGAQPTQAKLLAGGRSKHGTMLGIAFPIPAAQQVEKPPADESDKSPDTLIGAGEFVAPGPTPLTFKDAAKGTLIGTGEFVASGPAPGSFKDAAKGTLIGVAVPGIAPINPGVPKAALTESEPTEQHTASSSEPPEQVPHEVRPPGTSSARVLLWSLAGVAVALGLVALAAAWRWKAAPKLDVQVVSDEMGNDVLAIECKNCDDNVRFDLAGAKSQVRNHVARLPLRTPLKIGLNEVTVSITRGTARPEAVQLRVPVDFRITGDKSGLDENPFC